MPFAVGQARPLRWLVVAPFSATPSGRVTAASGERFATLMSRVAPQATVEIPDGLGGAATRSFTLEFKRPRDFRLSEVIKQVEVLNRLSEIAEGLRRKPDVDAAVAAVRKALGDGALVEAIDQVQAGAASPSPEVAAQAQPAAPTAPAPAPDPAATEQSKGSALDAIFAKADVAAPEPADPIAAAKSGLDAFIGAVRSESGSKTRVSTSSKSEAATVAQLIRHAVEGTALDLLAAPTVATLEASWRGFRAVVSASPGADDLSLDLMDSDAEHMVEQLGHRLDVDPMDRPDAVFVATPVANVATLQALAELGERSSVPVVVEVPPAVTGAVLEDGEDPPEAPELWVGLREQPSTRWLCVTTNAIVLANEEVGPIHRIVLGSPTWGVAAMVSASVGQTGGPGQIFGRAGALVGPASYALDDGNSIATERLASVDQQRTLADRGVLVLGSERGSDRLRLSAAPTSHPGADELQLPGRILAGRAARFAQAVREELPPHATSREVAARLDEAATNFLPRSPRGAVSLQVRTDDAGKLQVDASIGAALAGASFTFSSDV
ncbi:MAG: type VI secretion system contractile sheath small subunit [Deltaproteobacteria bacterium]|nr:type VI secretion system contractile sheath small subunit [Deltaproteobacteria bacterium]